MRDPLSWSLPIGRLFGITVRVHLLFPFIAAGLILRVAWQTKPVPSPEGAWIDAAIVMGFLFLSVVVHEFGHCFGARSVGGDAQDVLIWPLGGLANVDVPQTPRANLITAAAGPLVNLVLCVLSGVLLYFIHTPGIAPIWNPLDGYHYRGAAGDPMNVPVTTWEGNSLPFPPYSLPILLTHLFYVNWLLFLVNMVLIGFPLDGGRIFQSILWFFVGYRRATFAAVVAGIVVTVVVGLYAIICQEVLALGLAFFIFVTCMHQWHVLELGSDDSLFGYDFSQGYTSLEREHGSTAAPAPPKPSWWKRWRQQRAMKKAQRDLERREMEERRMDELLEKISTQGMAALSDEERRFMKQFSDRYRNRH